MRRIKTIGHLSILQEHNIMSKYDRRWSKDYTVLFFSDKDHAATAIAYLLDQMIAFEAYTPDPGCLTVGIDTLCFPDAKPARSLVKLFGLGVIDIVRLGPNNS
jgi:hypothetical protein